jgi:hypothetical protein
MSGTENVFNNNAYQLRRANNPTTTTAQSSLNASGAALNGEAGLITKYHTSPKFTENTNNLINRKRELILSSKKYAHLYTHNTGKNILFICVFF